MCLSLWWSQWSSPPTSISLWISQLYCIKNGQRDPKNTAEMIVCQGLCHIRHSACYLFFSQDPLLWGNQLPYCKNNIRAVTVHKGLLLINIKRRLETKFSASDKEGFKWHSFGQYLEWQLLKDPIHVSKNDSWISVPEKPCK